MSFLLDVLLIAAVRRRRKKVKESKTAPKIELGSSISDSVRSRESEKFCCEPSA
jgi:hypothetical protein